MDPIWVQHGAGTMRIRGGKMRFYVGYVEPWNIPIGEDDTRSGEYRFSIGNGHTGGKNGRKF